MIKGSLIFSTPIVKRFQSKKLSPDLGQILMILGDKYGFNIKFTFYNPQKAHPCVISRKDVQRFHAHPCMISCLVSRFWSIARKVPSTGLTCTLVSEKSRPINKNNFCYISPICPECPNGRICTKFGLGVLSRT